MSETFQREFSRRGFIKATSAAAGTLVLGCSSAQIQPKPKRSGNSAQTPDLSASALPKGNSPAPLPLSHFPDRLHAFIWRNWSLVPVQRIAAVVGATRGEVLHLGRAMGLSTVPHLTRDQQRRSYITVIKRNWHLLPYEQLLELLDWTPEQLAYTLREDDFLFVKLGSLKPHCEPLKYQPPNEQAREGARQIARVLREELPGGLNRASEPLFGFVTQLSTKPSASHSRSRLHPPPSTLSLRFCYSYFALYGDPLLETATNPYPDGYLAQMAESGVDGVWLQAVLYKLAPFAWNPVCSARSEERLNNLGALVERARRHGIGIYLYLNEPRAMPLPFYETHPHLKGVVEGDHAALCTSSTEVQKYLTQSVASICRAVPELGGFFTITASENLTNCWSHNGGTNCPRCGNRSPGEVIAEVNNLLFDGIQDAHPTLIVWDWGWADNWAEDIINRLPKQAALMSVSEWSLPIQRGGVQSVVGEYSISAIGPGPRAQHHWELARRRGLKTIAKIQAGNTWELSAVPYIPAIANVAQHAANLRQAKVDGLMLGWTLGGYPSPNLEVIAAVAEAEQISASLGEQASRPVPTMGGTPALARAMEIVASRRFGKIMAPVIVQAWREFSAAFSEFPFHVSLVYSAPLQVGPANLLWAEATGYHASMVGFPYDDLESWRAIYPPEVFTAQLEKVATGFDQAISQLKALADSPPRRQREEASHSLGKNHPDQSGTSAATALRNEINVAEAASIHFRSTANQARFVLARRALLAAKSPTEAALQIDALEHLLREELALARRLHAIQSQDSRIGFEASNQYYYVPMDLGEKILNCRDLLDRWLPAERGAPKTPFHRRGKHWGKTDHE